QDGTPPEGRLDVIAAYRAGGRRQGAVLHGEAVAVAAAHDRTSQRGVGVAVDSGRVGRDHRQGGRCHRERSGQILDRVIAVPAVGVHQEGNDGVCADGAAGVSRDVVPGGDAVPVLEAGDRAGEGGVSVAVDLAGIVHGNLQDGPLHGERDRYGGRDVIDGVVGGEDRRQGESANVQH